MSRKGRERREGAQAWKDQEHEHLPLKRFEVHAYHQVSNTYVVEARTEQEAEDLVVAMRDFGKLPEPIATREKHHGIMGAFEREVEKA